MSALRSLSRKSNPTLHKVKKSQCEQFKEASKYKYSLIAAEDKGMNDGRVISGCVILEILYSKYDFDAKKLEFVLEHANQKTKCLKETVTNYVVNYWCKRFEEKLTPVIDNQYIKSEIDRYYYAKLYEFYCSGCAVMFSTLVDLFDFSSNSKKTGRLDYIIEWCVNRYIEIQLSPDEKDATYFINRLNRKTGTHFTQ